MGLLARLRESQAPEPAAAPAAAGPVAPAVPARRPDRFRDASDALIRDIEAGRCGWQQPSPRMLEAPFNIATQRPYRGYNMVRLANRGYDDPRWMTFKQARQQGWHVRKGEKGTHVLAWDRREQETGRLNEDDTPEVRVYPVLVSHVVFNASQVEGPQPHQKRSMTVEHVRGFVEPLVEAMGMRVVEAGAGDAPGYDRDNDLIRVRPLSINVSEQDRVADLVGGMLTVAAGEATLKLDFPPAGERSEAQQAQCDLRMEMARSMMGMWLGLPLPAPNPLKDAPIVALLEGNKREAVQAAADADRMLRFILSFDMELMRDMEREHREIMAEAVALGAPEQIFDANAYDFWVEERETATLTP